MTTLDQIGIQRWRLRQSQTPIDRLPKTGASPLSVPTDRDGSAADTGIENMDWQGLAEFVGQSNQCPSCAQSSPILGEGNVEADWVFVIDEPSSRDIEQQQLLTGRGGKLFNGILAALGMRREEVYLASVFKCPPANNSARSTDCEKVIHRQISLIQPKIVVAFGELAAQSVIKANEDLAVLRSQPQRCFTNKLPIMPSHSLADILRDPILKADLWKDLKMAMSQLAD